MRRIRLLCTAAFGALAVFVNCAAGPDADGSQAVDAAPDTTATSDATTSVPDAGPARPPADATGPDARVDTTECLPVLSECAANAACCGGRCIFGLCTAACEDDAQCEALEPPCYAGWCRGGECQFVGPLDGPAREFDVPGDCSYPYCVLNEDGTASTLEQRPDDTDLPEDDGIECTIEYCINGQATRLADDSICDDTPDEEPYSRCIPQEGCVSAPPPSIPCFGVPPIPTDPRDPDYTPEQCGDGQDNDGDGEVDEACPCTVGDVQACWTRPPLMRGEGVCRDGVQVCFDATSPRWGPCENSFGPAPEQCDTLDNDGDGCVDNLESCRPVVACPSPGERVPVGLAAELAPEPWMPVGSEDRLTVQRWLERPPTGSRRAEGLMVPTLDHGYDLLTRADSVALASPYELETDVAGTYWLGADVLSDGSVRAICVWTVEARPPGMQIELFWDGVGADVSDLDLHVARDGSEPIDWLGVEAAFPANQRPSWGAAPTLPGTGCSDAVGCSNPRFTVTRGSGATHGSEVLVHDTVLDGDRFQVVVHARTTGREPHAIAPEVRIWCGDEHAAAFGVAGDGPQLVTGDAWQVATIEVIADAEGRVVDCTVEPALDGSSWTVSPL